MRCVWPNHGEGHVILGCSCLISLSVNTFYAFLNYEPLRICIWIGNVFQRLKSQLAVALRCLYAVS